MMRVKKDLVVLPLTSKLYVSRHVAFLEHIPFFSIPTHSHNLIKSDLIHIDYFFDEIDRVIPSTSDPSTIDSVSSRAPITSFPYHYSRRNCTGCSADIGTLVFDIVPPLIAT